MKNKKTLLIIEDDEDIQEYYDIILKDLNLNILYSSNGNDAIKLIKKNPNIDLILLDIVMPKMDGEQFLDILKNKMKSKIPVIPCSVDEKSSKRLQKQYEIKDIFFKFSKGNILKDFIKSKINI